MCGIHVWVREAIDEDEDGASLPLPDWLKRRGPDHASSLDIIPNRPIRSRRVTLQASVLSMRNEPMKQPVRLGEDRYLAWNGEVYQTVAADTIHDPELSSIESITDRWQSECSDTHVVAGMITDALSITGDMEAALTRVLGSLMNAEFALVVVSRDTIYYARDIFGRRSLLTARHREEPSWWLASAVDLSLQDPDRIEWAEVEPGKLHMFRVSTLETRITDLVTPSPTLSHTHLTGAEAFIQLEMLLLEAVERRIQGGHCSTSILFSGGLDSTVLASMALQLLALDQTLTLVNLCSVEHQEEDSDEALAADTIAARASYHDLQQQYPNHTIRFLEHRVSWHEIEEHTSHVQSLMYPKSSVMDLNIASSLWFAASACPDRIVLSGLGADELMGGYGRHRKAWKEGGLDRLKQELGLDLNRLWERNLGRDDRVISDTAHEARFPFLDAYVVQWLQQLPMELICDFSRPPGEGDKLILRQIAQRRGLATASGAIKRAIQFGSRMSQVADKRRYGSRRMATRMDA